MFHVVFLVKRHPAMPREEFARYWIEEHTPLTAELPGLRAYRCYPASCPADGVREDTPPFDGVAVLSFEDEAAYAAAIAGQEFAAAIGDVTNFQDKVATTAFFAAEHVIV